LLQYVKESHDFSKTYEAITKEMLAARWEESIIKQALKRK